MESSCRNGFIEKLVEWDDTQVSVFSLSLSLALMASHFYVLPGYDLSRPALSLVMAVLHKTLAKTSRQLEKKMYISKKYKKNTNRLFSVDVSRPLCVLNRPQQHVLTRLVGYHSYRAHPHYWLLLSIQPFISSSDLLLKQEKKSWQEHQEQTGREEDKMTVCVFLLPTTMALLEKGKDDKSSLSETNQSSTNQTCSNGV